LDWTKGDKLLACSYDRSVFVHVMNRSTSKWEK
jgi:hypothetical protein